MTSPARATDFANDRRRPARSRARARCPQMIDGTAVRPKVRRANTPRVKVKIGNADSSSSGEAGIEAIVVPAAIMSGDDGPLEEICRVYTDQEMGAHGLLVGSSFHLI